MEVRTLIRELKGPTVVAGILGVTPAAVCNWVAANAIPPAREVDIWKLAHAAGLDWSPPGAEGLTLVPREVAA